MIMGLTLVRWLSQSDWREAERPLAAGLLIRLHRKANSNVGTRLPLSRFGPVSGEGVGGRGPGLSEPRTQRIAQRIPPALANEFLPNVQAPDHTDGTENPKNTLCALCVLCGEPWSPSPHAKKRKL